MYTDWTFNGQNFRMEGITADGFKQVYINAAEWDEIQAEMGINLYDWSPEQALAELPEDFHFFWTSAEAPRLYAQHHMLAESYAGYPVRTEGDLPEDIKEMHAEQQHSNPPLTEDGKAPLEYQITYTHETVHGPETVAVKVMGTFSDAMYKAHSFTNCGYVISEVKQVQTYEEKRAEYWKTHDINKYDYLDQEAEKAKRQGHKVTKATRQYVVLAPIAAVNHNGRQAYEVLLVGNPGESRLNVNQRVSSRFGRFTLSLSQAKRSYKAAWKVWINSEPLW